MKASLLRTLWIMLISSVYFCVFCVRVAWMSRKKPIERALLNQHAEEWSKQLLKIVKVDYKVINPHNVQPQAGEATIVLCNHASLYDIPISFLVFPNHPLRMLAKKEVVRIPFMGMALKASESPIIDRQNKKKAIESLKQVRKLLKSGIVMWMAPEGTRSRDGKLSSFKKGPFITAIQAQATIIPIGIRGASEILPAKTFRFKLNQQVEVHVGKPIKASEYTLANKEELIERTHKEMLELVGEA